MSNEEIIDYIKINDICKEQFYGYLDNKMTGEMSVNFEDWCIAQGKMTKNQDGTYSPNTGTNYEELALMYLKSSQAFDALADKLGIDSETGISRDFQHLLENYDFNIQLPDGSTMNTTFKDLTTKFNTVPTVEGGKLIYNTGTSKQVYESGVTIRGKDTGGTVVTITEDGQKAFFSDMTAWDDGYQNASGDWDGESDIAIYDKSGNQLSSERGGWELEIGDTNACDSTTTKALEDAYRETHDKVIANGTVVFWGDDMLVYAHGSFRKVNGQCGNDTYKEIIKEAKGATNYDKKG